MSARAPCGPRPASCTTAARAFGVPARASNSGERERLLDPRSVDEILDKQRAPSGAVSSLPAAALNHKMLNYYLLRFKIARLGIKDMYPGMTTITISTFRIGLAFLLLLSIPLAVKAQTACMNCYNAFACGQKDKECTKSCKAFPFGDDRRIACDKSCQPMLAKCMAASQNCCGFWCTP
jgi:hypothetical protein